MISPREAEGGQKFFVKRQDVHHVGNAQVNMAKGVFAHDLSPFEV
jgi:hypothetical protein